MVQINTKPDWAELAKQKIWAGTTNLIFIFVIYQLLTEVSCKKKKDYLLYSITNTHSICLKHGKKEKNNNKIKPHKDSEGKNCLPESMLGSLVVGSVLHFLPCSKHMQQWRGGSGEFCKYTHWPLKAPVLLPQCSDVTREMKGYENLQSGF